MARPAAQLVNSPVLGSYLTVPLSMPMMTLPSPPYQSGDLPHDREERIGARSIESNVHLSRYKPEALPVELCGRVHRACSVHALRKLLFAGLARFASSILVLAVGVEPTISRLRSVCTAIVLRQHSNSTSPETSARLGSTGRGSALCTGALSLKTLSSRKRTHARAPSGASGSRACTRSSASGSCTRAPLRAPTCAGQILRSLTGVVVGHLAPS